jgi:DNA end-binding protein Ku
MQAIWKGVVSFGLVSIPVALYNAARKEELKLRMVRRQDLSPISYKRVADADGQEVPWDQIVKAYEYDKGEFVPLDEEDFKRARAEGVQSINITDFVPEKEIDPLYYNKGYYLQPEKGGTHAYALLRDALVESQVVGIAKVVIRSKQHLAALRPSGSLLMLELLHFENDIVDRAGLKAPTEVISNRKEMDLAKALISSMVTQWEPGRYKDDYGSALLEIIEEKMRAGEKAGVKRPPPARVPGNVVDVVEMLEKSLRGATSRAKPKARKLPQKKAA